MQCRSYNSVTPRERRCPLWPATCIIGTVLLPLLLLLLQQQWLSRYSSLLADYMSSVGLDLARYRSPPKSLYVQVRCLQDYGDFETEDGTTIVLARDTTHFLERSQCEKLIHQGIVEHVVTS